MVIKAINRKNSNIKIWHEIFKKFKKLLHNCQLLYGMTIGQILVLILHRPYRGVPDKP